MVLQRWTPVTQASRSGVALGAVPTVADINSPTIAELNSATAVQCSVTDVNASLSTDSVSVDRLCTSKSEQPPTTFTVEDVLVKAAGQYDQESVQNLRTGVCGLFVPLASGEITV